MTADDQDQFPPAHGVELEELEAMEEEPGPLCSRCGVKPNVPGEWLCFDCRDELAEQAPPERKPPRRHTISDSRGMDPGLFC